MPISDSDKLFGLIKSLDRSEKRSFKLYARRLESNKDVAFLKLFDTLDKMEEMSEKKIIKVFPSINPGQLSNLKRHLYLQIMKSLRIVQANKDTELQVREYVDFARILYGKGLYLQSLQIIEKIKPMAKKSYKSLLYFEILEFQKLIESRHITRSRKVANKVESIITQTDKLKEIIYATSDFLNLSLRIQGLYIKLGYVKSNRDLFLVKDYFYSNLPPFDIKRLSFYEYVLLHQSYVWFHHMTLNFKFSYKHAALWVSKFEEKAHMKEKDPDLFFRGLHYAMTSAFYLRNLTRFKNYYYLMTISYKRLEPKLLKNTKILYQGYRTNADLNRIFLEGNYAAGIRDLDKIVGNMEAYKRHMDDHRFSILNYKIAWLHFGAGDFETAIDYLSYVINQVKDVLRLDLLAYAKLLHLMCHYELKHFHYVSSEHINVKRSFQQYEESNKVSDIILELIRRSAKNQRPLDTSELLKYKLQLIELRNNLLTSRAFLYFDFVSWISALQEKTCIENITLSEYAS